MPRAPSRLRPILVSALGVAFALGVALAVEGAVSLWTGRSLFRARLAAPPSVGGALRDDELRQAATTTAGPFRLANDPYVGFLMKAEHEHRLVGVPAHTDADGMRVRPGEPPAADRPRIVVLGDSVAFGMGVADDATYAVQIERLFDAALPAAARRPTVSTIACPGWNVANSTQWLRTHVDRLDPAIVVLMPIRNDLEDGSGVTESGQRAHASDPVRGAEYVPVTNEAFLDLYLGLGPRTPLPRLLAIQAAGGPSVVEHVLRTGVSPESRRRVAALIDDIRRLRETLARRGAHLLVVFDYDEDFGRLVERALQEGLPEQERMFLFTGRTAADGLDGDPHPNPRCIAAGSREIVAELGRLAWVDGVDPSRWPAADARYAERRARNLTAEESRAWAGRYRTAITGMLGDEIRCEDGLGFHQVYSGMAVDGTVGHVLWVALASHGATALELVVTPLAARSLAELHADVTVTRADGGRLEFHGVPFGPVSDDGGRTLRCPLGVTLPDGEVADVRIAPTAWIEERVDGRSRLAAFRVRSLALR